MRELLVPSVIRRIQTIYNYFILYILYTRIIRILKYTVLHVTTLLDCKRSIRYFLLL